MTALLPNVGLVDWLAPCRRPVILVLLIGIIYIYHLFLASLLRIPRVLRAYVVLFRVATAVQACCRYTSRGPLTWDPLLHTIPLK